MATERPEEKAPAAETTFDKPPFSSSESVIEGDLPNRVGRPRKDGVIAAPDQWRPLPRPRFTVFRSDAPAKGQSAQSGLNYWGSFSPAQQEAIEVYVYRDHPILLEPPIDESTNKPKYVKNIEKISGQEPFKSEHDLLNRYGCGNYHLLINEVFPKKKQPEGSRALCTIWFTGVGSGDYKSNPPTDSRINDVEQVDLNHPANRSYVSFLRGRGLLPEQVENSRRQDEMANVSAVEQLTTSLKDVTNRAFEMAEKKAAAPPPGLDAMRGGLDVIVDSAKRGNEMLQAATATALETLRKVNETGGNASNDLLQPILNLVQTLITSQAQGGGNHTDEIRELRAELAKMQSDRIAALERQIEAARANPNTPLASPSSQLKDLLGSFREVQQTVEELRGGEDGGGKSGPWWVAPLMTVLDRGASVFGSYMQMQAAMAGRPPMPMQPPMPAQPAAEPQPSLAGLPAPTDGQGLNLQMLAYGTAPSILNYLQAQDLTEPGTEWAKWFLSGHDTDTLQEMIARKDAYIQALMAVPGFQEKLKALNPFRVKKFLDELAGFDFLAYQKELDGPEAS